MRLERVPFEAAYTRENGFSRRNTLNCLLLRMSRNKKGKERERKEKANSLDCALVIVYGKACGSMLGGKTVHLARELARERARPSFMW